VELERPDDIAAVDDAVAAQSADAGAVSVARTHAFLFRKVVTISLCSLVTGVE